MRVFRKPVLACFVVLWAVCIAAGAGKWGQVTFVVGDVKIVRDGKERAASVGMPVNAGDRIKTAGESAVDITQTGDGDVIRIAEKSDVEVEAKSTDGNTHAKVWDGEVVSNIKRLVASRSVILATPTATATIRGTRLSLQFVAATEQTNLNVFEGSVEFKIGGQVFNIMAGRRCMAVGQQAAQMGISKQEFQRVQGSAGSMLEGVEEPAEDQGEEGQETGEAEEEAGEGEEEAQVGEAAAEGEVQDGFVVDQVLVVPGLEGGLEEAGEIAKEVAALDDGLLGTATEGLANTGGGSQIGEAKSGAADAAQKQSGESKSEVLAEFVEQSLQEELLETLENVGGGPGGGPVTTKTRNVIITIQVE